ncbi:MAG: hypothetical protein J6T92_04365 [Ottowia sp.]|nr:hypothetical protein [Ottowia sp.]
MRFIAGTLNNQRLQNLLGEVIGTCTRVCAAVAYVKRDNMQLFEVCVQHQKPLEFFGRYDHTVAVAPEVLKWFLDEKSPQYVCKLVPDILHAKVIWWVGAGAYIGSANLSRRAWDSNIEAGIFLAQDELIEADMESELQLFFDVVREHARPLTDEIYKEQKQLAERRKDLSMRDYGIEQQFEESRLLPKNGGLNSSKVNIAANNAAAATANGSSQKKRFHAARIRGFVQERTGKTFSNRREALYYCLVRSENGAISAESDYYIQHSALALQQCIATSSVAGDADGRALASDSSVDYITFYPAVAGLRGAEKRAAILAARDAAIAQRAQREAAAQKAAQK